MTPRRPPAEAGFTLPELLMTVIVMGIISFAIATVLMQAITLVPEAGSRSGAAADRAFLVDDFSDDIANATAALPLSVAHCLDAKALNPSLSRETNVLTVTTYAGTVVYRARLFNPDGYETDYSDLYTDVITVTIERIENGGDPQPLFEGYCTFGDNVAPVQAARDLASAGAGVRHQKVTMTLRLRDTYDGPVHPVTLVATMRKTD